MTLSLGALLPTPGLRGGHETSNPAFERTAASSALRSLAVPSCVYTRPGSEWQMLFDGGGLEACPSDPETGYSCIVTPLLNLRYDRDWRGRLLVAR